ncbi:putative flavoprotein monooxygenase [Klebsiella pneumoniae]|nr:putative flavoprotein monooxygenase [Klebsiella pneumoniae]
MKAIVIGAGIGGLSAAVALKQSGIDCDVYEAVKEIKPVGAAISVWPNGVKCMAHLGMGDIMETFGGPLRRMAYRDFRSGENMTQFSLAPLIERTGSRPCPVSRAELQREMLDYWGRDSVQFGKRVTRCEEDADGVTVWFTDGSHSALRPWVLGFTPQRRYAGYVNWNGLVEIDEALAPGDQWTTFVGEGKRVSLMPVSAGRFYFFFDVPLPAGLAEDRDTLRADLSRYFAGWAPPVQKLIAALDPQTTNRIEIHDIEPFSRLVRGRVALLGDAGHSTTPDIGQGGCAAMERESLTRQAGYAGILARLADVVAALIVRGWVACGCGNATGWVQVLRDPRLAKAIYAMHQRPGVNWKVEDLAREAGLSRSLFAERFLAATGTTPARYLTELRMRLAVQYITHEGQALEKVAFSLGYQSLAAFSRAFKRITGQPPGALRATAR